MTCCDDKKIPSGASYVIYQDDNFVYLRDGITGTVVKSGYKDTDDVADIIQYAINQLAQQTMRGNVLFMPGQYLINKTITLYNGVGLIGQQWGWSGYSISEGAGVVLQSGLDGVVISAVGQYDSSDDVKWFPYLRNITLVGHGDTSSYTSEILLDTSAATTGTLLDFFIINCGFMDAGYIGARITNGVKLWLYDSYIEHNRNGVLNKASYSIITGCYLYGNIEYGIFTQSTVGNHIISNNVIWGNSKYGLLISYSGMTDALINISNNVFNSNSIDNTGSYDNIYTRNVRNIIIANNQFSNTHSTVRYHVNIVAGDSVVLSGNAVDSTYPANTATVYNPSDVPIRGINSNMGADWSSNLKVGTPADYTEIESDGTVVHHGNATVWDEMRVGSGLFQFRGTADPVKGDWTVDGVTYMAYAFDQSDEVFFPVQIPHGYKEGSDIYAHLHWTPRDKGATESGHTVAWKLDYTWANIDGTFSSSGTVDLTDTCDGTDNKHQMTSDVAISGTGKEISSMVMCRLYRDTGDTWSGTGASGAPAILEFDFHFEKNTEGSRQRLSK